MHRAVLGFDAQAVHVHRDVRHLSNGDHVAIHLDPDTRGVGRGERDHIDVLD